MNYIQWNLSYPGSLVHTTVRISEMSITKNNMLVQYDKITNLNTSNVVIAIS